jgi:phage terminase large subunit-like protein
MIKRNQADSVRLDPDAWKEWIRTDADWRAVAEGYWFDTAAAERVRTFFQKYLRHSKGQWAGKPFELLPWQWSHVIAPLFGWKRPDGTRRYRRGYIEVPKKNGKSCLFSALGLYLLIADGEQGAEVYSAAVDRDQASIIFNEAANMVEASPLLSSRLNAIPFTQGRKPRISISAPPGASFVR